MPRFLHGAEAGSLAKLSGLRTIAVATLLASSTAAADPSPPTDAVPSLQVVTAINFRFRTLDWAAVLDGRVVSDPEFLHLVGRDDLADELHRHKILTNVAFVGSALALGIALYASHEFQSVAENPTCYADPTIQQMCSRDGHPYAVGGIVAGGASVALLVMALAEIGSTPRLSAAEAAALAARYNATHVAPYATPDGAGISVQGRF